tara:strand:+ start:5004 stop:5300 length:297 start_codon:yes stop_codon:yes gene_type:complete
MHPTTGAATPSRAFLLDVAVPTKNSLKNKSVVGNPAHKTSLTSADDITFVGSSKPVDTIDDNRRPHVHASTPHVALGTFNAFGTRSSAPGVASGHNAI